MTKDDVQHLAQVTHSLQGCAKGERSFTQDEFDRLVDRMLWAIHASSGNPRFSEKSFADNCRDGSQIVWED